MQHKVLKTRSCHQLRPFAAFWQFVRAPAAAQYVNGSSMFVAQNDRAFLPAPRASVKKAAVAAATANCSITTWIGRSAVQHAAAAASGRSSISGISRRQLTLGAALAAATAGFVPWSRVAQAAGRGGSMATAAHSTGATGTGIIVVYVTAPNAEVADTLASALVEQQLVACVNIVPGLTSVYTWKGKVEKEPEVLLIMKTQEHLLPTLTAKVQELHPYDEPEVIGLPVLGGSASYMQWVRDNSGAKA